MNSSLAEVDRNTLTHFDGIMTPRGVAISSKRMNLNANDLASPKNEDIHDGVATCGFGDVKTKFGFHASYVTSALYLEKTAQLSL